MEQPIEQKTPGISRLLASAIFALVITLVLAALQAGGIINMGLVRILLLAAWLVGVVGILLSDGFVHWKHWRKASVTIALALAVVLYGVHLFIERNQQKPLTAEGVATRVAELLRDIPAGPLLAGEFIRNGGFELKDGSWSFVAFNGVRAIGQIDSVVKKDGHASFHLENSSPLAPNVYGLLGQRMFGLQPNRWYRLRFQARSAHGDAGAMFFTTDTPWVSHNLPRGPFDWREFIHDFTPGPYNFADLIFVAQAPLSVWLDSISVTPLPDAGTAPR